MASLSAAQKKAVKDSWVKVQAAWAKATGPELFIRLFEKYPAIKAYFKMFDGMDSAAIRSSSMLRAHVCNFEHAFASFVDHLDDLECLVLLLNKFAENHHKRGINPALFTDAFAVYMALIKETAGCDGATMDAWAATLKEIQKLIADKMATL